MANAKSTAARAAFSIANASARIEALLDDLPFADLDGAGAETERHLVIANALITEVQERIACSVICETRRVEGEAGPA